MGIRKLMLVVPGLALAGLAVVPQGVAAAAPAAKPAVAPTALAAMQSGAPVKRVDVTAREATAAESARLDATVLNDSHGCSGSEASNNSYVHVCYVRDGDVLWVKDDESNGRTAVGEIVFYDAGDVVDGFCYDPYTAASGKWAACGFPEADENQTLSYRGFDTDGNGNWAHYTAWQDESSS